MQDHCLHFILELAIKLTRLLLSLFSVLNHSILNINKLLQASLSPYRTSSKIKCALIPCCIFGIFLCFTQRFTISHLSRSIKGYNSNKGPLLTESEHIIDITNDSSSSSIDDQQPHEGVELRDPYTNESVWNSIEFVVTLVLIAAAIIVLIQPRDVDHPQTLLSIWIIGYTCGCIATLPILCWRFWHYNRNVGPESIEEYQRGIRIDEEMDFFMTGFFVGWFVVFLWIFSFSAYNSSALDDTTTQFYWLCMALLTFSFIRYVRLNLTMAMVCYILPLFLLSPVVVCVLLALEVFKGIVAYIVSCI